MSGITTCPDAACLQNLLDGRLSDEQQAHWNRHLENCANCQQRLEALAAGKDTWTYAVRSLNAGAEPVEIELQRMMTESKQQYGESETTAEAALDFLEPSDDPSHLGKIGQYEVIEALGRGGMSIVVKAIDPSLHRVVAIKVLAPQLATTAAARARFQREGYAAAAISHEHVVGVYGVDEINGLPYLVMEYISGESLQERLDRAGPLELKEVLRIGMQTAQGLAAAHAQGLVHRDIKPANILLHNGVARVKITDFGLARAVDDATLTQSGLVAGTPQYMSPEQARGDTIDARTDLFSLGSVLYAMCTGRPPFRASTTMGVLKRVSDETPRPVREVNADVPAWLAEIIARLHARNPAERYQSAAEVAELLGQRLAEVQQGAPASPTLASLESISLPPSHRSVRTWKRPWAIAAALLPVIAGMFVVSEATGVTNVTEFLGTVLRISTPEGTLVVESDDPGVEVIVDGEDIKIHGAGPKEIRVRAGDHRIRATKDGKEVPLNQPLVTVTRGGKTIVRIRQESARVEPKVAKAGTASRRDIDVNKPATEEGVHQIAVICGHEGVVRALAFTPNGKALISAGGGREGPTIDPVSGEIRRWDIAALRDRTSKPRPAPVREVWNVSTPSIVFAVALSGGGGYMATAEGDGTVRLHDADDGRVGKVFRGHKGPVYTVAFGPQHNNPIVSAGLDRTVKVWLDGRTQELLESFDSGNTERVNCVAFSPDGKTLAVGGEDHHALGDQRLADADGNIINEKRPVHTARLFNVGSWKVRAVLVGHEGPVRQLAFSPDGKLLTTASDDRTVKLWDVASGKELAMLKAPGPAGKVRCLAFSPDGKMLATGGDAPVAVWSVASRRLLHTLEGQNKVFCIAFSPDGRTLAFGGADRTIKLWNIAGF